jgi:pyruvate/2-oxoglutarate dehydrogenase complex dihydrolipoamide acyltransferase (E2) component
MQISNSFLVVCVAAAAGVVVVSCAHHRNEPAKADQVMAATQIQADKAAKAEAQAQAQAQAKANREKKKASPAKDPLAFKRLEAPPLPVSAGKQGQLSDLLRRYKVDEVTPEQYQEQRAKILAQP